MREDLATNSPMKPRGRSIRSARAGGRARSFDDLPMYEGTGNRKGRFRQRTMDMKTKPHIRYLHRNVGRKWDDVWTEISARIPKSDPLRWWIIEIVRMYAPELSVGKYGELRLDRYPGFFPKEEGFASLNLSDLYVDPNDRILKRGRGPTRHQKRQRETAKYTSDLQRRMRYGNSPEIQYHRLSDGAWWEVTLAELTEYQYPNGVYHDDMRDRNQPYYDVVLSANLSPLPRGELYGTWNIYATSKRQLSRREAKRLGLRR